MVKILPLSHLIQTKSLHHKNLDPNNIYPKVQLYLYNLNNLFGDNFLLFKDSYLANSKYSHVAKVQFGTLSMRYRPPNFTLYLSHTALTVTALTFR